MCFISSYNALNYYIVCPIINVIFGNFNDSSFYQNITSCLSGLISSKKEVLEKIFFRVSFFE